MRDFAKPALVIFALTAFFGIFGKSLGLTTGECPTYSAHAEACP